MLASKLSEHTGIKVRGIELSLLQRAASHTSSLTDVTEAFNAGKVAVEQAVAGETDKMVAFERVYEDGKYVCKYVTEPLTLAANTEKKVPLEWINEEHNGLKKEFIDYVLPLIQGEIDIPKEDGLPRYAKLKKIVEQ